MYVYMPHTYLHACVVYAIEIVVPSVSSQRHSAHRVVQGSAGAAPMGGFWEPHRAFLSDGTVAAFADTAAVPVEGAASLAAARPETNFRPIRHFGR